MEHPGLPEPVWVFQTDSDGQTDPGDFEKLWKSRSNFDAVMGVRVKRGDGFSRAVVMRVLRLITMLTMHAKLKDVNVPYRLMRADALKSCLAYIPEEHNLTNLLLSVAFVRMGKRVASILVSFTARIKGEEHHRFGIDRAHRFESAS